MLRVDHSIAERCFRPACRPGFSRLLPARATAAARALLRQHWLISRRLGIYLRLSLADAYARYWRSGSATFKCFGGGVAAADLVETSKLGPIEARHACYESYSRWPGDGRAALRPHRTGQLIARARNLPTNIHW